MSDYTDDEIAVMTKRVLYPWYFITVELDQVYHFTTGPEIVVDGVLYERGYVKGLRDSASGCTLQIRNDDRRHTMLAMWGQYNWKRFSLGHAMSPELLYLDQDGIPYADQNQVNYIARYGATGRHIMSGFVAETPNPEEWLTLVIKRSAGKVPRDIIEPPFANHTRPEDTIIAINQSTVRITRDRNVS